MVENTIDRHYNKDDMGGKNIFLTSDKPTGGRLCLNENLGNILRGFVL